MIIARLLLKGLSAPSVSKAARDFPLNAEGWANWLILGLSAPSTGPVLQQEVKGARDFPLNAEEWANRLTSPRWMFTCDNIVFNTMIDLL
jgi:hypothetical protein